MKIKVLSYLLGGIFAVLLGLGGLGGNSVQARECGDACNGIKLNTCFPVVKDCIEITSGEANPINVVPGMMRGLTRYIMGIILVVCFIMIIIAGIMRAGAGEDSTQKTKAKDIIKKVAITVLLLGFSGAILRLINPNFFG